MNRENGFSLVELMIALLLGSLLTIASIQLFLVNRQTENLQTGVAGVQDSGRFAFDYLTRNFMSAGLGKAEAIIPFVLDGSVYHSANPQRAEIMDGIRYDAVVVRIEGGKDCLGNDLVGYKRFHVLDDAAGKRLVCTSYEKTQTVNEAGELVESYSADESGPLVDNVEAFQVLYGIDFDAVGKAGYGFADVYTNASGVKQMVADINSTQARLVSVRFSILLASAERVTLDPAFALNSIQVLDQRYESGPADQGSEINFKDGRLYRTYSSTIELRNVVSGL